MKQRQKVNAERANFRYAALYNEDRSDNEQEGTELLRVQNRQGLPRDANTVEKVVEEGDTLQALSIRYRCTIAELKRLNNIHRENEIFAKRTIKVPRRAFAVAGVHSSGTSSPHEEVEFLKKKDGIDTDALNSKLESTLSTLPGSSKSCDGTNFNEVIFNSNLIDKSVDNGNVEVESDSEERTRLLPNVRNVAQEPPSVSPWINCSGADADISWIALIICIVVLIFAVPLIYVFYIAEHLDNYHHQHLS